MATGRRAVTVAARPRAASRSISPSSAGCSIPAAWGSRVTATRAPPGSSSTPTPGRRPITAPSTTSTRRRSRSGPPASPSCSPTASTSASDDDTNPQRNAGYYRRDAEAPAADTPCPDSRRLRVLCRLRRQQRSGSLDLGAERPDPARQDRGDPGERGGRQLPRRRRQDRRPACRHRGSALERQLRCPPGPRQRSQQPEAPAHRPKQVRGPERDDNLGDHDDGADDDRGDDHGAHGADHHRAHPDTDDPDADADDARRLGRHRAGRTMSPRSPRGELVADRYRIEDRLGSGGMSSVFRATDTILERTVAVKILAEHLSDDERFVARFRREALAVAKLVHPNIVQVYDTGIDGGSHYIVMEYVRGKSGAQLLQSEGTLDPQTSVAIGVQA